METLVTKPWRHAGVVRLSLLDKKPDSDTNIVSDTTPVALIMHRQSVVKQSEVISAPHLDGRMVLPTVAGHGMRVEYLLTLDALFVEPLVVEHSGALIEFYIREECLHVSYVQASQLDCVG